MIKPKVYIKQKRLSCDNLFSDSARIQTWNRLIRSQVLYSVELRSHLLIASANIEAFFLTTKLFDKKSTLFSKKCTFL